MRIHVYKDEEGNLAALVEPSLGRGKPPVLCPGITAENVVAKILPEVVAMRKPSTLFPTAESER